MSGPAGAPLLLRQALPPALCARWLAAVAGSAGDHGDGSGDGGAVGGNPSRPLTALPALDPQHVLHAVAHSALAPLLQAALGPAPWCDISQSWLRHGRPPHSWHQDGALRHDFIAHAGRPAPAAAALQMRTAWIALTPCGDDAPGLQWVMPHAAGATVVDRLLSPAELTDAAVAARHPPARHAHARMAAGDALLFDGLLLHRTQLRPGMQRQRTSLELRFFRADAIPARLAGDAGLRLPQAGGAPAA